MVSKITCNFEMILIFKIMAVKCETTDVNWMSLIIIIDVQWPE